VKKPPRKIPEVLDPEEQARMLGELERSASLSNIRNLALIRLLLNAGLRAREARELKIKHLDFKTGRLKVRGKGRKERVVWLSEDDLALIRAWLTRRGSSGNRAPSGDLLFTSLDGSRPVNDRWLRRMVKAVAEKAGIVKDIHPHSLRHTFATDLLRATKNLRLVQKALGHSNIETTTIYAHIVDEELENAMKELRNGKNTGI
jgi:site-specific recombinase XerD